MHQKRKYLRLVLFWIILFFSGTSSAQWTATARFSAEYVYCFASAINQQHNQITEYQYAGTSDGIYISTNYGTEWTQFKTGTGLEEYNITALVSRNNVLFAGTYGGVHLSTNYGAVWKNTSTYESGFLYPIVSSIVTFNQYVLAGTTGKGVYITSDNGVSWRTTNKALADTAVSSLILVDNDESLYVFAGTRGGVFVSSGSIPSWYPAKEGFITGTMVDCLCARKNGSLIELFAATTTGLYKSTNFGAQWYKLSNAPPYTVNAFAVYGTHVFIGTAYGIYRSSDGGANWINITDNLPNTYVRSLGVLGPYLMAGTYQGGVWRRHLSQIGVPVEKEQVPSGFSLSQNYPNPFNPSTVINYSISEIKSNPFVNSLQHITLKIYDSLGREIKTIVDELKSPGSYSARFDASKLSNGVYFYKLTCNGFSLSKKMILLK